MSFNCKRVDELPLILNVKDVMSILRISKTNTYALFNRSDFPTINIGRRKMVSKEKFLKWLDSQTNVTFSREVI